MKRILAMLLVILLLTACGAKSEVSVAVAEEDRFDTGTRYYLVGKYEEAIVELRAALEEAPEREDAWLLLAKVYEAMGEQELAAQCLMDAIVQVGKTEAISEALQAMVSVQQTPEEPAPDEPEEETPEVPAEPAEPAAEETPPVAEPPVLQMTQSEVEPEVARIREIYHAIVVARDQGWYVETKPQEGMSLWMENGAVRCMVILRGCGGVDYSRSYYFENGQLIFAYLEGQDAYRLYFKNGCLFRMRYSPNCAVPGDAVNYDLVQSQETAYWQDFALGECMAVLGDAVEIPEPGYPVNCITSPYFVAVGTHSETGKTRLILRVDPGPAYEIMETVYAVSATVNDSKAEIAGDLSYGLPHGAIYEFYVETDIPEDQVYSATYVLRIVAKNGDWTEHLYSLRLENGIPV